MMLLSRFSLGRAVWTVILLSVTASAAATAEPADDGGPWGEAVDGLTCRLTIQPRAVIGQAIQAVVEVKNISSKKRYIVPRLDPQAIEWLAIEIVGPNGKMVRQGRFSKGYSLNEKSFQPIEPGEIKRFEVIDLRNYFNDLQPWQFSPFNSSSRRAFDVTPGQYTLRCRFRSPKVPDRFVVAQRVVEGKVVTEYKAPPPEMVAGQWAGEVKSAPVSLELRPLGQEDLLVHEWGVFTVFNDVKYANSNRKEEWGSLPSFFYRQFPKPRLRWVQTAVDKPIVYFYAKPEPLHVNVQVQFGDGAPVVWWPAAASPLTDGPDGRLTARVPQPFRTLVWEAWIGQRVPSMRDGKLVKVEDFALPANCWVRDARLPDASPLTVIGSVEDVRPTTRLNPTGLYDRSETERFLYYDGLVPAPDYLRCEQVEAESVTLRNRARFDLKQLFVVDRRAKDHVGFFYWDGKEPPFKAGTSRTIELRRVAAKDWPSAASRPLRQALLEAGLFEAEADALLKINAKQLLEADGITVFHILPVEEYDRMLPLDILPAPAVKPVRVGLALHPHMEIEPNLTKRVTALIRQLDDDQFERRSAAAKELLEIGPLAIALLRAELQKQPPLEVRTRIESILERVDAAEWLKVPATPAKK